MNLCILRTPGLNPLPDTIRVVQEFGPECLTYPEDGDFRFVRGTSVSVSGTPENIYAWASQLDGLWVSVNPVLGEWRHVRVKDAPDFVQAYSV